MAWKKYVNLLNILLLVAIVSLVFFGNRWYSEQAAIGAPDEYQNYDSNFPTWGENSTLIIDDTNINSLLGHTGDGSSWSTPYVFEESLLTEYFEDQGKITLSVYNVSYLIIRLVRFEGDAPFSDVDGLVVSDCDNVTIRDCFFLNFDDAVRIEDSDDITLYNNTAYQNDNGVFVSNSPYVNITENIVVNNGYGIYVLDSDNGKVLNNTAADSGNSGIYFEDTDHGQISGNNVMYNREAGAIFLDPSCTFNTVSYNIITDCRTSWIYEGTQGDNTIENNTATYSRKTLGLIILASGGVPALALVALLIRAAVKQRSVTKHFKKTKKPDDFWLFFSYATVNSKMYRIPELAKKLEIYEDIDEVFYWEQKMTDDIFEYMEKYIKDCNVILLFCSKEAIASEAVKKEWMSSLKIDKKIIPIFRDTEDIPALLTTKLGVQFNPDDFDKFVNDVYALIKKKTQE